MRKPSTNKAKGKKNRPKAKLGIPNLEHSKAAVLRSLDSPDSRRGYQHAIDEFVAWYCSEPRLAFNKTVVLRYRFHLVERALAPGTLVSSGTDTDRKTRLLAALVALDGAGTDPNDITVFFGEIDRASSSFGGGRLAPPVASV
jgi:hypothetical protein